MTTPHLSSLPAPGSRLTSARAVLLALALLALLSASLAASAGKRMKFDIPAGDAGEALRQFSTQAGEQLLFFDAAAAGVKTRAVRGDLTSREALARMLADTGLIAVQDEKTGAIAVRKESDAEKNVPRAAQTRPDVRPRQNSSGSATAAGDEEILELTPFTVSADADVGYLAGNTLAGSRLNTRLKDTAASISIFTEEFLRDLGAFDLSEALVFGNNLQLNLDDEGGFGDAPAGNPTIELPQTYRVRGLPASVARNYFRWVNPSDVYNVERVEDSRGPNSVLFGIGSAGGVINVSTKQAQLGRTFTRVQAATGSYESWRGAIDHNQALIGKTLSLRLNGVWNRENRHRFYTFSESRRGHAAVKYRPFANTQIRAEFERGEIFENVPRAQVLFDWSIPWFDAGRPIFESTAPPSAFSAFGSRLGANQFRYIADLGRVVSVTGQILTSGNSQPILDPRYVDDRIHTGGPAQERSTHYGAFSAFAEQRLGRNTFMEAAFSHQRYSWRSFDPQNAFRFYGDPNATLPGVAGPNPFAGQGFLESVYRIFDRKESSDTGRLTFSTELDGGKWGFYRVATMGEYEKSRFENAILWEIWDPPLNAANPHSSANRVIRRSYVTLGDWRSYKLSGPRETGLIQNMTDPVTGRVLSSRWGQNSANDDPTEQKSALVGTQAFYFDRRLVIGAGYRVDDVKILDRGIRTDPATREIVPDYGNVQVIENRGHTATLGVVGHVTKQISVLYNQSTNTGIPDARIRVLPHIGIAPPAEGEGRDYGIGFDLFDGRIYARAVRFTTKSKGEVGFRLTGGDGFTSTATAIVDGLEAAGLISAQEANRLSIAELGANGSTFDRNTEGYEFQLTANPTKNWRLSANYSRTEGVEANIAPEVRAWWAEMKPFFAQYTEVPTTTGKTVGVEMTEFETSLADALSFEGIGLIGNRKHKANFVTRYTFPSGFLKGVFVGGGYRYQGRMTVGRTNTTREVQWAPPYGEANFFAGHTFRLPNDHRIRLQLNINNLFDETERIITRYAAGGDTKFVRRYLPRAPRTWRLTADYSF